MIVNLFQHSGQAQLNISLTPLPTEWPKLNRVLLPTVWPKLNISLTLLPTEWPKLNRVLDILWAIGLGNWVLVILLAIGLGYWVLVILWAIGFRNWVLAILWAIGLGLENKIQSVCSTLEKLSLVHTDWWWLLGAIIDAICLTDSVLFLNFESWFPFFISSKENDTNFCSIVLLLDDSSAQYF